MDTAAIILAAGKSTRMNSDLPKVLHEVCGRPMLSYVINACQLGGVERICVVVGYRKEQVLHRFEGEADISFVEQKEQLGTGHAVLSCHGSFKDFDGSVLVIAGDMPLVQRETIATLLQSRERSGDAVMLATTTLEDPTGYGRIVRNEAGGLEAIVEDRDCTPEQRAIREVNPSYYCFDAGKMFASLQQVKPDNAKGEYYITDAVRILREANEAVSAISGVAAEDATGINSRLDLSTVNRIMQDRIQLGLMGDGVTIVDPDNTWIEADVSAGRDTVVCPFTFISTGARIGANCRVGPFAWVEPNAIVEDGSIVGPQFQAAARGQ